MLIASPLSFNSLHPTLLPLFQVSNPLPPAKFIFFLNKQKEYVWTMDGKEVCQPPALNYKLSFVSCFLSQTTHAKMRQVKKSILKSILPIRKEKQTPCHPTIKCPDDSHLRTDGIARSPLYLFTACFISSLSSFRSAFQNPSLSHRVEILSFLSLLMNFIIIHHP